ncbi:hypothetical protein L208DRAFT_1388821 [Tricholoma matsutake]|nr:hypothetical protein L208DRAFT_1388821 [Tricholoma matsutake 945]
MALRARWQDQIGLETINTIVKILIPTWTNGLHLVQLELVSTILDGQDILCCTTTGDGNSAAFSIPCLVLMEYNRHLDNTQLDFPHTKDLLVLHQ